MVRKKVEGNEEQRRAAARRARQEGEAPSARKETTGASKQRTHLRRHLPHEERAAAIHEGKQQWEATEARLDLRPEPVPEQSFGGPGDEDYTESHERVFRALMEAQQASGGEAVYLDEIVRGTGLPHAEVRVLLHDLSVDFRLVTELEGSESPDMGPRFEAKPRL